jgi:hypothetical protein
MEAGCLGVHLSAQAVQAAGNMDTLATALSASAIASEE